MIEASKSFMMVIKVFIIDINEKRMFSYKVDKDEEEKLFLILAKIWILQICMIGK
jgi:hypothetical protein